VASNLVLVRRYLCRSELACSTRLGAFDMPLLQLNLTDVPLSDQQRNDVLSGLTARMASLLGKRADLTVVTIAQSGSAGWSLAGQSLEGRGWCASLTVHITADSNTAEEQAVFIESAFAMLQEVLAAPPAAPVYIIVNEIAAHSWGFDGRTQLSRRSSAPPDALTT
jgi:4-oxalocrotonate tautomerase